MMLPCLAVPKAICMAGSYNKIHEMALDMSVPLIGLNDSPGARVIRPELAGSDDPYRVSDEKHGGAVFSINTRCSGQYLKSQPS
jgi:acetyl-CoA carboxylase carboxyltransferase component